MGLVEKHNALESGNQTNFSQICLTTAHSHYVEVPDENNTKNSFLLETLFKY